jgi:hypothetical protein
MEMIESRTLFEIYRESGSAYDVVYFTELTSRDRDEQIERAMNAEHVFDGFIAADDARAKECIAGVVARLNAGEELDLAAIRAALAPALLR